MEKNTELKKLTMHFNTTIMIISFVKVKMAFDLFGFLDKSLLLLANYAINGEKYWAQKINNAFTYEDHDNKFCESRNEVWSFGFLDKSLLL